MPFTGDAPTSTRCCRNPSRRAYVTCVRSTAILDADTPFDEFQANQAPSMVVERLGRLGCTVGVLANNPLRLGGC